MRSLDMGDSCIHFGGKRGIPKWMTQVNEMKGDTFQFREGSSDSVNSITLQASSLYMADIPTTKLLWDGLQAWLPC